MKIISAIDLADWSNKKDSQQHLPYLVRRLIFASSDSIKYIEIPIGDSTYKTGLDGLVEQNDANLSHIPVGYSAWECGTNKNVVGKANEDYEKRTKEDIPGINKKDITFVFVTSRPFKTKNEWIEEKKLDNAWKDVCVIDDTILETLLEYKPSVAVWFAKERLNKNISYATCDLWHYWQETAYSTVINKVLSANVFISNRDINIMQLNDHIAHNTPSPIFILSNSIDESIAFIFGALSSDMHGNSEKYLAKTLVVKSEEEYREVINFSIQQIIIIKFHFETIGLLSNIPTNHLILVPCNIQRKKFLQNQKLIELNTIDRNQFIRNLIENGFERHKAMSLANKSGLQFNPFFRHAGMTIVPPKWSLDQGINTLLIPLMFLGSWDGDSNGDQEIIAKIANLTYQNYIKSLQSLKSVADLPITINREHYESDSGYDLWANLHQYITLEDLAVFDAWVLEVFKETDPALELDINQRWAANLFNKNKKYSDALITGILKSLLIVSKFGDDFDNESSTNLFNFSSQAWCDRMIKGIFGEANSEFWMTYYNVLPLIAEISPSVFLTTVKGSLNNTNSPIMRLFGESESGLGNPNYYCKLLWALETVAFLPDYLILSCLCLTDLAILDTGRKMVNSPINSLKTILNPLAPQNSSSLVDMYDVIAKIMSQNLKIAWIICINGLNHLVHGCTMTMNPRPAWDMVIEPQDRTVEINGLTEYVNKIFDLLLANTEFSESRVVELIHLACKFKAEIYIDKVIEYTKENSKNINNNDNLIYKEILKTINLNKQFPEASWKLPQEYINKLAAIQPLFYPNDELQRAILHFDTKTHFENTNHQEDLSIVENLFKQYTMKGVITLAKHCARKHDLAFASSNLTLSLKEINSLYKLLIDPECIEFIRVIFFLRSKSQSTSWFNQEWENLQKQKISLKGKINFLTFMEPSEAFYQFLSSLNEKTQLNYWQNIPFHTPTNKDTRIYVANKFLFAKRYFELIRSFYYLIGDIPTSLLIKTLYQAGTTKAFDLQLLDPQAIQMVFNELDNREDINSQQFVQLELLFSNVLNCVGSTRETEKLHEEMSKNPQFFLKVIFGIYNSEGNIDYSSSAYNLLNTWKVVPGIQIDKITSTETINLELLYSWVNDVRNIPESNKYIGLIDDAIGKVFVFSPKEGPMWPHSSICEIIEEIESETLNNAFIIGTLNKRGISIVDNGESDNQLKEQYFAYADLIKTRYYHVAELLRSIANHYSYSSRNYKSIKN